MFSALDISTSALVAQRTNIEVIAGNIANKDVTRDAAGNSIPYRRRVAMFATGAKDGGPGVHVAEVMADPSEFRTRWAPDHPDAIKDGPRKGYLFESNIDYHTEMVNAMTAMRAYEANVTVIEVAKSMAATTLRLIG